MNISKSRFTKSEDFNAIITIIITKQQFVRCSNMARLTTRAPWHVSGQRHLLLDCPLPRYALV